MQEAIEKCQKAEAIQRGSGAYNMACAYALLGNEAKCRKWLGIGGEEGTLPTYDDALNDPDLEAYWKKGWFKGIRWEGEDSG